MTVYQVSNLFKQRPSPQDWSKLFSNFLQTGPSAKQGLNFHFSMCDGVWPSTL